MKPFFPSEKADSWKPKAFLETAQLSQGQAGTFVRMRSETPTYLRTASSQVVRAGDPPLCPCSESGRAGSELLSPPSQLSALTCGRVERCALMR